MARTAIIGLGITGYSCLRYLHGGDALVVLDSRAEPPMAERARAEYPDVDFHFGVESFDFQDVQRAVVSPGVAMDGALVADARSRGLRLSSDIDLFCAAAAAPVIAITGTNGKSTVTALTGHLLASAGKDVGVGGNLGEPALELLSPTRDAYVLELSSFQLERMDDWAFAAATILNLSEDHLDRHGSLEDYAASKQRIYRSCALAVVNRHDARSTPQGEVPSQISFGLDEPEQRGWGVRAGRLGVCDSGGFQALMETPEVPLPGRHNLLNILAACALAHSAGVGMQQLASGVRTFTGLSHRCEQVGEHAGVTFIDDSKATNVGATAAALEGLGEDLGKRLVVIAGGDGKGADFSFLRDSVHRFVKALVLMGRDAQLIEDALRGDVPVIRVENMREAVARAWAAAEPGDVVILSPACASMDMFENFADRGRQFAAAVRTEAA